MDLLEDGMGVSGWTNTDTMQSWERQPRPLVTVSGLLGQVLPKAGPMGIKTIPGTVINLLGIVWTRFVCVCVCVCVCVYIHMYIDCGWGQSTLK